MRLPWYKFEVKNHKLFVMLYFNFYGWKYRSMIFGS